MITDSGRPITVFLMGPTASGKSDLAIRLAERLPVDIISADSAMVYRGLDIGTAKPDAGQRQRIPHALIDLRDPADDYSVADFRAAALDCIRAAHARRRHALVVGGTSLYFRALEYGLSQLPERQPGFRQQIRAEAATVGWAKLHTRLADIDGASAARIHPNDAQRIERALEIYSVTGCAPSLLRTSEQKATDLPGPVLKFIVAPSDRSLLAARIDGRLQAMVDAGFWAEVENLFLRPDLDHDTAAMRAVGYRQLWRAIADQHERHSALERAAIATRQLAKRQLTWLRRQPDTHWLDSEHPASEPIVEQGIIKLSEQPY